MAALVLPLVAQSLAVALDSRPVATALRFGTVLVTAILLTVDAALLGTVDRRGRRRSSPVALFLGIVLLWVVCYPLVFFRRRHFGRPNLAPLALPVAGFFTCLPLLHEFSRPGTFGEVPTCTSREVVRMVDELLRADPRGASVQSVTGHREISYDPVNQTRKGQCLVRTRTETVTVGYTVRAVDRRAGTFQVEIEAAGPGEDPTAKRLDDEDRVALRKYEEAEVKAARGDAGAERLYQEALALWEEVLPQATAEIKRRRG